MTETTTTPPKRTRVYRHCQNPKCGARLKKRQADTCSACLAAEWQGLMMGLGSSAVAVVIIGAALKLLGVL